MKILSKGKTTWSKEFTCSECGAKLKVETSDLVVGNSAVAYAGETWEPYVYYMCPVCSSYNVVTKDIPSGLRETLVSAAAAKYYDWD